MGQKLLNDALTGSLSSDYLEHRLPAEQAAFVRSSRPLACILVQVNPQSDADEDAVICNVGQTLQRQVRAEDVVCRHRDNQFVVLTPGVGAIGASLLAERLRLAIQDCFERTEPATKARFNLGIADAEFGADELLTHAEAAADVASRIGPSEIAMFDRETFLI